MAKKQQGATKEYLAGIERWVRENPHFDSPDARVQLYRGDFTKIMALAAQSETSRTWKPGDRRVVCAALRSKTHGNIVCGPRHWDALCRGTSKDGWEQGFVDQFCKYMTREEALHVALANGQIIRRCGGDDQELFSENLY